LWAYACLGNRQVLFQSTTSTCSRHDLHGQKKDAACNLYRPGLLR
jgi:hypothetical protein